MPDAIERALEAALTGGSSDIGEIRIAFSGAAYVLFHREDAGRRDLHSRDSAEDALALARFDDFGKYRALKTAPTLGHGWQLQLATLGEVRNALDHFYPGRLAVFAAAKDQRLSTTSLRETLDRQTGMYRVASKITDAQINDVAGNFCRSNGGCLRTILWKRDAATTEPPSDQLPPEKFDLQIDQAHSSLRGDVPKADAIIPLLCQEACNLLVGECRKAVQAGRDVSPEARSEESA